MSSRYEELLNLLMNDVPDDVEAQSRIENILQTGIDGGNVENLPAPQSRVEAYLMALIGKSGGGGTSGPVSWNDLEDKPFDREIKYTEIFSDTLETVLDEYRTDGMCTATLNEDVRNTIFENYYNGQNFKVVLNDEEYILTLLSGNYGGVVKLLGNAALADDYRFEDTGEPFVFGYCGLSQLITKTPGVYTITIYAEEYEYMPMDGNYLPSTVSALANAWINLYPETRGVVTATMGSDGNVYMDINTPDMRIPDATGDTIDVADFNGLLLACRQAGILAWD